MQTTKLGFIVMIGLAMIDFSIAPSLNAETVKAPKSRCIAARTQSRTAKVAKVARPTSSLKGVASVYADTFIGRKTASGQRFCQSQLTAAHRSLPFGTTVRVTNLRNRKSVEVRINDRGPHISGRLIDLSVSAAKQLGMGRTGNALVQLEVLTNSSRVKS